MASGNKAIERAIFESESITSVEFAVFKTHWLFDWKPERRAKTILELIQANHLLSDKHVFLYINAKTRRFVILLSPSVEAFFEKNSGIQEILSNLHYDLHSTHMDNAIALTLRTLAVVLETQFPL